MNREIEIHVDLDGQSHLVGRLCCGWSMATPASPWAFLRRSYLFWACRIAWRIWLMPRMTWWDWISRPKPCRSGFMARGKDAPLPVSKDESRD